MPAKINECGCCEGITAILPCALFNRPGLPHVRYRLGTQVDFLQSALAALSDPQFSALRRLTTHDTDDFTIALLDAWATVADVLTFYQERIANEFWLRTATERDSILRLAQLIGYREVPGSLSRRAASMEAGMLRILEKLDNLSGRPVDNTHFFPIDNYERLSDEYLYDQLLVEFREWLDAARREGICR